MFINKLKCPFNQIFCWYSFSNYKSRHDHYMKYGKDVKAYKKKIKIICHPTIQRQQLLIFKSIFFCSFNIQCFCILCILIVISYFLIFRVFFTFICINTCFQYIFVFIMWSWYMYKIYLILIVTIFSCQSMIF